MPRFLFDSLLNCIVHNRRQVLPFSLDSILAKYEGAESAIASVEILPRSL